ncbi:MAG: hypothetical protein ACTSSB_06230 [Candidatus Heimdallarchaeota archaeon]
MPAGGLKDDIGRLSVAFDRITQRLTDLEMRLNAISPPAAAPEGATPVVKAPEPAQPQKPTKIEPPHLDEKPDAVE